MDQNSNHQSHEILLKKEAMVDILLLFIQHIK